MIDPLAEFREVVDTQRVNAQYGLNSATPGAGIRQLIEILAVGFGLVIELLVNQQIKCQNCRDMGRVSTGPIPGRIAPLVGYCPRGCEAAKREILRDTHINQLLNPGAPQ